MVDRQGGEFDVSIWFDHLGRDEPDEELWDAAWRHVVRAYTPKVTDLVRRNLQSDPGSVDGLVADIWTHVSLVIHQCRGPETFEGWVRKVAYTQILRRARDRKRLPLQAVEAQLLAIVDPASEAAGADELVIAAELHGRIISQLAPSSQWYFNRIIEGRVSSPNYGTHFL